MAQNLFFTVSVSELLHVTLKLDFAALISPINFLNLILKSLQKFLELRLRIISLTSFSVIFVLVTPFYEIVDNRLKGVRFWEFINSIIVNLVTQSFHKLMVRIFVRAVYHYLHLFFNVIFL